MSEGKSFYIHAPATGKASNSSKLTAGTDRLLVVEDRTKSLLRRDVSGAIKQIIHFDVLLLLLSFLYVVNW